MRAFALRLVSSLVVVAGSLVALEAGAQSTGGYLPPNVRRPPAGAAAPPSAVPPAPYPSTATPGASGAAAAQIRLIEPENSPNVAGAADGKKPPEVNRDAAESELRLQPRSPAGTGPQDPTMPGPNMRDLLGSGDGNRAAPAGPPPLPELRIRARIFARNKPPVAVIDVAGRQLSVRVGSEIQFSTAGGVMQLKVVELTMNELQIEVVGRKQIITLN